jgi:hypothetical protein
MDCGSLLPKRYNRAMRTDGPQDPTAIASGDERAASRFGYCMASAIVDELRNGQG